MAKTPGINGTKKTTVSKFRNGMKKFLFEEKKTSAKDDDSLVYGEKDRFHYAILKRRMHRNFSTKSNLNELEIENLPSIQMPLFSENPKPILEEKEENEASSSNEDEEDNSSEKNASRSLSKKEKDENSMIPLKKNTSQAPVDTKLRKEAKKTKRNTVKKVISMPILLEAETARILPINNKTRNGHDIKTTPQYDEIFFYYFESFLDQFMQKKLNRKRLSSQG